MGRPSVTIVSRIGVETTKGTAAPANRFLPTISFNPKVKRETKQFRAQGNKYNTSSVKHKQSGDGTFDGVLDYNSIVYLLNGLVVPVSSPTGPVSGSTTAYQWDFIPSSRQLDNPKTFTIEKGDAIAADRYTYGQMSSLTVDWGQDDLKMQGNLIAQTCTPNVVQGSGSNEIETISIDATSGTYDLTVTAHSTSKTALLVPYNLSADDLQGVLESLSNIGVGDVHVTAGPVVAGQHNYIVEFIGTLANTNITPMTISSTNLAGGTHTGTVATTQGGASTTVVTDIPERPVQRDQVDVFLDPTFAAIGDTQIVSPFEEQMQLGEKFKGKFAHNTSFPSWQEAIEIAPSLVFSFMSERDSQGRATFADVINSDEMQFLRILCTGLDLSTAQDGSVTELIQWDLAGKFTEPEEIMDAVGQGVYADRYHFVALDNDDMPPWQVSVVNTLAAL